MDAGKIKLIQDVILYNVGAAVSICVDTSQARNGLKVHFEDYTRNEGPNFLLRPKGLKRHFVEFSFGSYSNFCINRINEHAGDEQYAVARALLSEIAKRHTVSISGEQGLEAWRVSSDLTISVTITEVDNQHDEEAVVSTTKDVMVPLIAALAELMGFEDVAVEEGEVEGRIKISVVKRRERSARNRLLALSIHGNQCGACGYDPVSLFGETLGMIIEVHHVEPLSEVGKPRTYDPTVDLIPLCPNCHRMIHKRKPAFTLPELKHNIILNAPV